MKFLRDLGKDSRFKPVIILTIVTTLLSLLYVLNSDNKKTKDKYMIITSIDIILLILSGIIYFNLHDKNQKMLILTSIVCNILNIGLSMYLYKQCQLQLSPQLFRKIENYEKAIKYLKFISVLTSLLSIYLVINDKKTQYNRSTSSSYQHKSFSGMSTKPRQRDEDGNLLVDDDSADEEVYRVSRLNTERERKRAEIMARAHRRADHQERNGGYFTRAYENVNEEDVIDNQDEDGYGSISQRDGADFNTITRDLSSSSLLNNAWADVIEQQNEDQEERKEPHLRINPQAPASRVASSGHTPGEDLARSVRRMASYRSNNPSSFDNINLPSSGYLSREGQIGDSSPIFERLQSSSSQPGRGASHSRGSSQPGGRNSVLSTPMAPISGEGERGFSWNSARYEAGNSLESALPPLHRGNSSSRRNSVSPSRPLYRNHSEGSDIRGGRGAGSSLRGSYRGRRGLSRR